MVRQLRAGVLMPTIIRKLRVLLDLRVFVLTAGWLMTLMLML